MPPKQTSGPTVIESFKHEDKRTNIPTADSHDLLDEQAAGIAKLRYPRNPELDPQLVWNGKDAQDSGDLVVDAPPIYIQEKIDPRVLIENLRRTAERPEDEPELTLFDTFDGLDGFEAIEYYQHQANWSNRMILGDSLQVMASLAEKENLRGKVQMIYIDPPYGIKFGSNFQPFVGKRNVKDGKIEDVTREAEQIKAFRDTWQLGIHSYLSYLRDRLIISRDLLTDSGTIFIQIGDENVHLIRALLDEIFGSENFISLITVRKTTGVDATYLAATVDFILWYGKDAKQTKYRQLYVSKVTESEGADRYDQVLLSDGTARRIRPEERVDPSTLPTGAVRYRLDNLTSDEFRPDSTVDFEFEGRTFHPGQKSHWKTTVPGLRRLEIADRLEATKRSLNYRRLLSDFSVKQISNLWADISGAVQSRSDPKVYVVQSSTTLVQRCLLMATDPGDLVLDPTCGSGTTAVSAEQ
ncbi:site-specific DNA-methyltransferase [Nonomuraea glycinis]|uniref:DNA methylase N-4/N-6 domain-containing protein n=1 Tax=Nonomuraea glycinis TaxID=2047744 RepID=A0A918AD45_9ACTN|nr:site-specific DNA-methyltransferase [Nonomuraea glycinis]MCA2180906.1 site-specific DNA-methyltransferase [Nonomuraea glycinis]GGP12988.1 hypothetical protein GCM10012278_62970 [Nonomuraea glycinis]